MKTSTIPCISSLHGQERRLQRDICKRDLQAAVKYGEKEEGYPHPRTGEKRWKYTFAGIVYITDESSTQEITSWALPIPLNKVEISERMREQYEEAKRRLQSGVETITSHSVFVVDKSGSMKKSDLNGHRTRSRAVYFTIAEEFLAPQLGPCNSSLWGKFTAFTDVVSIVEMRENATVVIQREPVSWILYNQLVELSELQDARSHGVFYNSLRCAFEMLRKEHTKCALSLFFLSDGRPSDDWLQKTNAAQGTFGPATLRIFDLVKQYCKYFDGRLTLVTYGFGKEEAQFTTLEKMIECTKETKVNGAFATGFDGSSLKRALSSVLTSLTHTRTLLSRLGSAQAVEDTLTEAQREAFQEGLESFSATQTSQSEISGRSRLNHHDWRIFNNSTSSAVVRKKLEYVKINNGGYDSWLPTLVEAPLVHEQATGFAVRKSYFGKGAERIVYMMTEIDKEGYPVGDPLVAKESKFKHRSRDATDFHKTFIRTQMKAENMAEKFNARLDRLQLSREIPRVEFLRCSVYVHSKSGAGPDDSSLAHSFLSEPCIDDRAYCKWNDNAGGIDGIAPPAVANGCDATAAATTQMTAGAPQQCEALPVEEEEGESDCDDDYEHEQINALSKFESRAVAECAAAGIDPQVPCTASEQAAEPTAMATAGSRAAAARSTVAARRILDSDVPQAFTHFTYQHSKRKLMVCDIQGVLDHGTAGAPVFRLTDPCIHYESTRGRWARHCCGVAMLCLYHLLISCSCRQC